MVFKRSLGMLTICCSVSHFAHANNRIMPDVDFAIKPVSCVVNKLGDDCTLNATVHWSTSAALDLCLYQDDKLLHCWQRQRAITMQLPVSMIQSTTFFLKTEQPQEVVASQKVQISAIMPKAKRRRLRSDWSIF